MSVLKASISIVGFLFLLLSAEAANATGFFCPATDAYIEEGQSAAEVERLCGSPAAKEPRKGRRGSVVGEKWIYDFGPGYFVRMLVFLNGRLVSIEDDGYGHGR